MSYQFTFQYIVIKYRECISFSYVFMNGLPLIYEKMIFNQFKKKRMNIFVISKPNMLLLDFFTFCIAVQ